MTTTCLLCSREATHMHTFQTSRGTVSVNYSCDEHFTAPTFASFGGGWVEHQLITK